MKTFHEKFTSTTVYNRLKKHANKKFKEWYKHHIQDVKITNKYKLH